MKKRLLLMLVFAALILVLPANTYAKNTRKKTATTYVTVGKTKALKVRGYAGPVRWKSRNRSIVVPAGTGQIRAVKPGKTFVYTKVRGKTYTYQVVAMKISKTTVYIKQGLSKKIQIRYGGSKVKWKSSNTGVAKVSKGKVTAVGPGVAVITANAHGRLYKCKVIVPSVKLSELSYVLTETPTPETTPTTTLATSSSESQPTGKVYTEYFTVAPRYSSSNSSVARVDSLGNISIVGEGMAFIKVQGNGLVYRMLITVSQKPVDVFLSYMDKYNTFVKRYGSHFVRHETPIETYEEALRLIRKGKKVRINCRAVACWVFHDMGIDPYTIYAKRGTFSGKYKGSMTNYLARIKKGHGVGMTCKKAIDLGLLKPGDICCFKGITHTFTYTGRGYMFYDGGLLTQRAGYSKRGLCMDYTKVSYYSDKHISEILRWR